MFTVTALEKPFIGFAFEANVNEFEFRIALWLHQLYDISRLQWQIKACEAKNAKMV